MSKFALLSGSLGCFIALPVVANDPTTWPDCSKGDTDVSIVSRQEPYYPHSALMFCLSGEVKARFTIDAQGKPKDIRIVESEPEAVFDQSAAEAIEQWRFSPACRDGSPAEREAAQTIEFRLPGDFEEDCAEAVSKLDDEAAVLLGELGARYALLAQYWRTGGSWSEVKAALETPFPDFEGDLGRVADFHRQALERIPDSAWGRQLEKSFNAALMALQPPSLAEDPNLDTAHELINEYHSALDEQVERSRESYLDLKTAYRSLKEETGLDQESLQLMVTPFIGNFELPFEDFIAPRLNSLEDFRSILDFLESNRGAWRIADNQLHFQREADEQTWQMLWDELIEQREALRKEDRRFMRSFRDYSD